MGDRTSVELTILIDDLDFVKKQGEYYSVETTAFFAFCRYEEVNYADLGFEESLQINCIPYSKYWEPGGSYSSGKEHFRFDNNGKPVFTFSSDDEYLAAIRDAFASTHGIPDLADRIHFFGSMLEEYYQETLILSWESQEHNKKLARTLKLISQD